MPIPQVECSTPVSEGSSATSWQTTIQQTKMDIRKLGSQHNKAFKFGVIYNVVDPEGRGILPNGTTVAWGWKFGVAWRYTAADAQAICSFIESCYDTSNPKGLDRFTACGPISVPWEKAQLIALQAASIVSQIHREKCRKFKENSRLSLNQRVLRNAQA